MCRSTNKIPEGCQVDGWKFSVLPIWTFFFFFTNKLRIVDWLCFFSNNPLHAHDFRCHNAIEIPRESLLSRYFVPTSFPAIVSAKLAELLEFPRNDRDSWSGRKERERKRTSRTFSCVITADFRGLYTPELGWFVLEGRLERPYRFTPYPLTLDVPYVPPCLDILCNPTNVLRDSAFTEKKK